MDFKASVISKVVNHDGSLSYELQVEKLSFVTMGQKYDKLNKPTSQKFTIHTHEHIDKFVGKTSWDVGTLIKGKAYTPEFGLASIAYQDDDERLLVEFVLGTKTNASVTEILREVAHHEKFSLGIDMEIDFSANDFNPRFFNPTFDNFMRGELAFTTKPPRFAIRYID